MSDRNSAEQLEKKVTSGKAHTDDHGAMIDQVLKVWKEQQQGTKVEPITSHEGLKGGASAMTCAEIIGKTGPDKIDMCAEKIDWKDGGKGSKIDACAEIVGKHSPGSKIDLCAEKIEWKDGGTKGPKRDACAEVIKPPAGGKGSHGTEVNTCAALVQWPNHFKDQTPPDGIHKIGEGKSPSTLDACAAIIKPGKQEPRTLDACASVIKPGKQEPKTMDTCAAIIKDFPLPTGK